MAIAELMNRSEWLTRLGALLLTPRREWGVIAAERPDRRGLYLRVILPLAAIPPVAKLVSWSLVFGFLSFGTALLGALLAYGLTLVGVFVLAIVAARLAPYFDGEERFDQALRLVAYAAAASWLGGIFRLVPVLAVLSLLATLYSLVLLALGAPALLAVPPERAPLFAAAMGVGALCLLALVAALMASLLGVGVLGMA